MKLQDFISELRALLAEVDGVPDKVRQYAHEIEKAQNGKDGRKKYSAGKSYATAWSKYCAYKAPGSSHCHQRSYFR